MAEDLVNIFKNLQISAYHQDDLRGDYEVVDKQYFAEENTDIGEDNEDFIENMLRKEDIISTFGLTSRLPSRMASLPWLLEVRRVAIRCIVKLGGSSGVRKITVYTAMIYVDRFLSSVPKNPKLPVAKLLAIVCLYLACEQFEEYERLIGISTSNYIRIMSMRCSVIAQFGGLMTIVNPIQFVKYFLSKFCKDLSRKEYARIMTVEVIMSTLGDVRLMSLRPVIVGAAAFYYLFVFKI